MSCRPLYVPVVMFVIVVFCRVKSQGHNLAAPVTAGILVLTFATFEPFNIELESYLGCDHDEYGGDNYCQYGTHDHVLPQISLSKFDLARLYCF